MADIKDRIKSVSEYFKEMKVATSNEGENLIYVITVLPSNWVIDESIEERYKVQTETQNGYTYFWADLSVGFDVVFDAIDFTIKENKNAQEKILIFNQKVKQLQEIFSDVSYSVEQLRDLKFDLGETKTELPFTPTKEKRGKKKDE